jgi:hypothetical protein
MKRNVQRFVEINAKEQVYDLKRQSQAVARTVFTVGNSGFVTDLKVNISSNKELDEVYQLINKNRLRDFFYSISKFSADGNFGINFINIGNNKLPREVKDSQ